MNQEKMNLPTKISLKPFNTWGVGGSCSNLVTPKTINDALDAYLSAKHKEELVYILGGGSNVLISDSNLNATVIHSVGLNKILLNKNTLNDNIEIEVESGFPVQELLAIAVKNNLSGLEFLTGIPGTFGGVLWGNAGAGQEDFGKSITRLETIEKNGTLRVWNRDELNWKYRTCPFNSRNTVMITKCFLSLKEAPKEGILEKIKKFAALRKGQPYGKMTAGCVFKNPDGMYAGRLLEDAKCKGLYCGDAIVSTAHANFIENTGNASASDIFYLSEMCKKRVYNQYGVELEYEIRFFGDF